MDTVADEAGTVRAPVAIEVCFNFCLGTGLALVSLRSISATKLVSVQHRFATLIEDCQIKRFCVGFQSKLHGARGVGFHEREGCGLVPKAGGTLIAHECRVVAEQDEVEIVVVVVVHPDGFFEGSLGQGSSDLLEDSCFVAEQAGTL